MLRAASQVARRAWSRSRPVTIAAACRGGRAYSSVPDAAAASDFSAASAAVACAAVCGASALFMPTAWAASREQSFIMIKPDGVHRALVGRIIERFEARGYKLVGIKVLVPSKQLAQQHYAEHDGKPFFPKLVDFLSSGAVVAMVWEGNGVVATGRAMIGKTNPLASDSGTIRGDFAVDMGRNIIHGSDSVDSAQKEIALWFKPAELAEYQRATEQWLYEK